MAEDNAPDESADPLALGQAAASQLGGEWQLDLVEVPLAFEPDGPTESPAAPFAEETTPNEKTVREATGGTPSFPPPLANDTEPSTLSLPPSPEQLVEAMLFVGGHPLTAPVACSAVRGLTTDRFQAAIDALNRRYREQWRPYTIDPRDDGFVLVVRPTYRNLRERLFGGPRETRLSQPALDVLSIVAYRQPVGKAEVDAIRGTDSGPVLRQLVRLGLAAVQHRADATGREVRYGTTPRFLQTFGLGSLDELPRLGEAQRI
jgi:segregation and condensation protein B